LEWRPHGLTYNEPAGFENCMLDFLINIHQSQSTEGSALWYAIFWEFFLIQYKNRKYTSELRFKNAEK
jgi:hypothetical protein